MSEQVLVKPKDEQHAGIELRQAREKRGLQQEDIAKQLRLSLQTIKDIETYDFRQNHALTYVKGYLRSYARIVDLSAEKLVEDFMDSDWAKAQLVKRQTPQQTLSTPTVKTIKQRHKRKSAARWIGVAFLLGLMVLVISWWQGQKAQPHLKLHNKPLLTLPSPTLPQQAVK